MQGIPSDWGVIFLSIQSIFEVCHPRESGTFRSPQLYVKMLMKIMYKDLQMFWAYLGKCLLIYMCPSYVLVSSDADALLPPAQEASREDQLEKPTVKISHYEVQTQILC